jgi:hypothetical protein
VKMAAATLIASHRVGQAKPSCQTQLLDSVRRYELDTAQMVFVLALLRSCSERALWLRVVGHRLDNIYRLEMTKSVPLACKNLHSRRATSSQNRKDSTENRPFSIWSLSG